ncbi:glycoside-pentoside-hexuronide (GPH):cation symporter [Mucilaginibacter sp.]|uniref:glycoside-pentoside-hexuronide (GPH):cation symporter n=1 Tax=Mucilaginibacter sp. TaxID=1882438 RepID=UPI002ED0A375
MRKVKQIGLSEIWRQRLGYGVADLGCNLVWQMLTLYLMFFYTDVAGISSVQVGILFLVARIIDGNADLLMGLIIDKTRSRWGRSRPYFLWGALPFTVFSIAAFYVPNISVSGKLIYAYITYTGLSLAYTMVNMPLTSILPSLTNDAHERTVLATSRILFSFVGATVVAGLTLPLVKSLGHGVQKDGFFRTMIIYAISGGFFIYLTFLNVKERTKARPESPSFKASFSALNGNRPWQLFAVNILFMWGAYFLQQGTLLYFYTYNVSRPDLAGLIATILTLVPLAGTACAPLLAKRYQKRSIFLISSGIHLTGILIMMAAGNSTVGLIAGSVVSGLGFGLRHTIYFSMQADPVDYGEWKTGVNAGGLIAAVNQFTGKIAMAGSGALAGLMLTWGHYLPHQQQTPAALMAIKLNYLYIPAFLVIISMMIMSFYRLDKILPEIKADIDHRSRDSAGVEPPPF